MTVVPLKASRSRNDAWLAALEAAVLPQFKVDVYLARAGDPVLFGVECLVPTCPSAARSKELPLCLHTGDSSGTRAARTTGLGPSLTPGCRCGTGRSTAARCTFATEPRLPRAFASPTTAGGSPKGGLTTRGSVRLLVLQAA